MSRTAVVRLLGLVTVVAVLAAAWAGWSWWRDTHDEATTRARDRDAVLSAASAALVALNTMDYHNAGPSVDRWLEVTTGTLGSSLNGDRQLHLDRANSSRTESTATVNQAAVADLHGDTARVIAVLDVRLSTVGEPGSANRARLNAELTRTPQGWKVDSLQAAS